MIIFPYATEKGIAVWSHPAFMALVFVCVPAGALVFGILSDYVSARVLAAVLCGVQAVGFLLFTVFGGRFLFFAFPGIVGGVSVGGLLAVMPLLMMKYYGPRHLGKIAGVMTAVCGLADLGTVVYMRSFHEAVNSYRGVALAAVAMMAAAAVAVFFAGRPNRRSA